MLLRHVALLQAEPYAIALQQVEDGRATLLELGTYALGPVLRFFVSHSSVRRSERRACVGAGVRV
jgi:hypothetical protein